MPLETMSLESGRVKALDFHPHNSSVLCASFHSGAIVVYCLSEGVLCSTGSAKQTAVRAIKFIDEDTIAAGGDDGCLRVYDMQLREQVCVPAHDDYVRGVSVGRTTNRVLSCGDDKIVKLWDSKTWELLAAFNDHAHYVMSVSFCSDESRFLSASLDCTIKEWHVSKNDPTREIGTHARGVNSVCCNETMMVTCSDDTTVGIWQSGNSPAHATGHTKNVSAACFLPNSNIVTVGEDGCVRLWDPSGDSLGVHALEETRAWCIACCPGMEAVVVGTDNGIVVLTPSELAHGGPAASRGGGRGHLFNDLQYLQLRDEDSAHGQDDERGMDHQDRGRSSREDEDDHRGQGHDLQGNVVPGGASEEGFCVGSGAPAGHLVLRLRARR